MILILPLGRPQSSSCASASNCPALPTLGTTFLKIVSSAIIDKYIGESGPGMREMFGYARERDPSTIYADEIESIGEF